MSSYDLFLCCFDLEKIRDIQEFYIRPYCHILDCTSGLDSRMIVIQSAFESCSDIILFDQKKFTNGQGGALVLCTYVRISSNSEIWQICEIRVALNVLKFQKYFRKSSEFQLVTFFLGNMTVRDMQPVLASGTQQKNRFEDQR